MSSMKQSDKLNKEVGSLACSIRTRLVNPAESLENRVSLMEQKILLLKRLCFLLATSVTISLAGVAYLLIR